MKKIIFILTMFLAVSQAFCQSAVRLSKPLDNVSVGAYFGAQTGLKFDPVFPVNPVVGLKIQKDISTIIGFNTDGSYGFNSENIKFTINNTVNITNIISKYNKNRKFNMFTECGVGADWNLHGNVDPIVKTGLVFSYDILRNFSLYLNPAIHWNLDNNLKFNKNNANLGLYLGFMWSLPHTCKGFEYYNINELNNTINNLRNELDKKPKEVIKTVVKTETVTNTIGNIVVYFAQDSYELTATSMAELSKIPNGSHVSVIGSASPEGTRNYNLDLSNKRAEVVAKYLSDNGVIVDSYQGIGVTDNTSNRVVTVYIK